VRRLIKRFRIRRYEIGALRKKQNQKNERRAEHDLGFDSS
jgi:hypothetical protein